MKKGSVSLEDHLKEKEKDNPGITQEIRKQMYTKLLENHLRMTFAYDRAVQLVREIDNDLDYYNIHSQLPDRFYKEIKDFLKEIDGGGNGDVV